MFFLGFTLILSFSRIRDYRLFILCYTANIHLWLRTLQVHLSVSGLPHSGFFSSPIHLHASFKMSIFFNCWILLHCVNVHLFHPFFSWGHLGCFQSFTITKKYCYDQNWTNVLVVWFSILWGMFKSAIAETTS